MRPEVSYPREADTPVSHLPFSPAVRVGNMVFVSGQASVDITVHGRSLLSSSQSALARRTRLHPYIRTFCVTLDHCP